MWLVVQLQLAVFHCAAQPALDLELLHGRFVEFPGVVLVVVAAKLLGTVHGDIGIFHQFGGVVAVARIQGDADTAGDEHFLLVNDEFLRERFQDPPRNLLGVLRALHVGQQYDELVASQASHHVGGLVRTGMR